MSTSNYKRKLLTIPVLSLKENDQRCIRFDSVMRIGKAMPVKEGKAPMDPATIADVTDVISGEVFELIVPAVLQSVLHENFPDDSYVGKVFELEALPKREGKQYRGIKAHLLEYEGDGETVLTHESSTSTLHKNVKNVKK